MNYKNELLKFICQFDSLEIGKGFYLKMDCFLKERWNASAMTAFSIPLIVDKVDPISKCRFKCNKDLVEEGIQLDSIRDLLKESLFKEQNSGYCVNKKEGIFKCGQTAGQQYFLYVIFNNIVKKEDLTLFSEFLLSHSRRIREIDKLKALESLVHIDDVTGLFNQRKLMKDLDLAISRFENCNEEFSVVFIDIDHFKSVNDEHGHLVGTQLLFEVGKLLRKISRNSDLLYRYGGDEFVLLVKDASPDIASKVATRLLNTINNNEFHTKANDIRKGKEGSSFKLTVSMGVAGFPYDAKDREDILGIADKMMYQAKEAGRGRVRHAFDLFKKKEA